MRRGVAAGATALLFASFGVVVAWGRQPAAKVAAGRAGHVAVSDQPQADPYGYDPYGYDQHGGPPPADDQGQAQPSDPSAGQRSSPAPMTTRQS